MFYKCLHNTLRPFLRLFFKIFVSLRAKNPCFFASGQILQKDILCKPEDKELDELYTKYKDQTKIDYDKLPKCSEFKLSSKSGSCIKASKQLPKGLILYFL